MIPFPTWPSRDEIWFQRGKLGLIFLLFSFLSSSFVVDGVALSGIRWSKALDAGLLLWGDGTGRDGDFWLIEKWAGLHIQYMYMSA